MDPIFYTDTQRKVCKCDMKTELKLSRGTERINSKVEEAGQRGLGL